MKTITWLRAGILALLSSTVFALGPVIQDGPRYFATIPDPPEINSITFVSNAASDNEYGRIQTMPSGWGAAEFTFSMWVRLTTGTASSFTSGTSQERTDWWSGDASPYGSSGWWFDGNFLLDGHTNAGSAFYAGTFSLQVVGPGRIRWLFGDGSAADARTGDLHAIQASPSSGTASLRDGAWHHIECVRRFDGGSGSILELWIDGVMVASETSTARTNMYTTYWDDFAVQDSAQRGWFLGAEKQAAVGIFTQYADFKGEISEIAMFDRAKSTGELEAWTAYTPDNATGLLEVWYVNEPSGSTVTGENGTTMSLNNGGSGQTITRSSADPF